MPPTTLHQQVGADASVWGTFLLGVAFRHVICGVYLFNLFIFLPVRLPSEIRKIPPDLPVWGFPGVWKLPLLRLPSRAGSPSLAPLSLFLSFIFCPTSFWRQWAAFLGAWWAQLAIRVVLWSLLCVELFFRWICRGESGIAILFLRHLPKWVFNSLIQKILFTASCLPATSAVSWWWKQDPSL